MDPRRASPEMPTSRRAHALRAARTRGCCGGRSRTRRPSRVRQPPPAGAERRVEESLRRFGRRLPRWRADGIGGRERLQRLSGGQPRQEIDEDAGAADEIERYGLGSYLDDRAELTVKRLNRLGELF